MEKKNFKYLLISVCLALLIASIGGVVVGAAGTQDNSLAIKAETLDINGRVGIAFAVPTSVYNANNGIRVELYDADPALGAANKIQTIDQVLTNDNGENVTVNGCVVFVSDGFDPYDFADTVYARVETDSAYGATRATGVLELAYKMLNSVNGLETLTAAQQTRKDLYLSLIEYHDKVQQVFNPNYVPVSYITVADGILDGKGNAMLVKEGQVFSATSTFDASSLGMAFVGWSTDGSAANMVASTFTAQNVVPGVIQNFAYEPMFAVVNSEAWLHSGAVQKTVYSAWNSTGIITNSSTINSPLYEDDGGNASPVYNYRYIKQVADESGIYLSVDHDKAYGVTTGVERLAVPASVTANSTIILSYDFRLNAHDYNNNGFGQDDVMTELNKTGDAVNTGTGNLKFNVAVIADATGYSGHTVDKDKTSNDMFDIMIDWKNGSYATPRLRTAVRTTAGSDKHISSETILSYDKWYNVQLEFITDDSYVKQVKVYLDGVLVATRTMGDATYPLSYKNNVADTAMPVSSINALGFSIADSAVYKGVVDVRDIITYSKSGSTSKTNVVANDRYVSDDLYVVTANATAAKMTFTPWNQLSDGLIGYASNDTTRMLKPVYFDALTNEIVNYAPYTTNTSDAGQTYYLFENPLYGKSAAELAGKTLSYSMKLSSSFFNGDGDGTWNENADNGKTGSSMIAYLLFGFTNGDIAKTHIGTSALTGFTRVGVTSSTSGFNLRVSDINPAALNDTSCTTVASALTGGRLVDVKVEVLFDANGEMDKVTITVTDSNGNVKSCVRDDSVKSDSTQLNDFTAVSATTQKYFGMASTVRNGRVNTLRYTGFSYSFN